MMLPAMFSFGDIVIVSRGSSPMSARSAEISLPTVSRLSMSVSGFDCIVVCRY